jgi:hypothetical protein
MMFSLGWPKGINSAFLNKEKEKTVQESTEICFGISANGNYERYTNSCEACHVSFDDYCRDVEHCPLDGEEVCKSVCALVGEELVELDNDCKDYSITRSNVLESPRTNRNTQKDLHYYCTDEELKFLVNCSSLIQCVENSLVKNIKPMLRSVQFSLTRGECFA